MIIEEAAAASGLVGLSGKPGLEKMMTLMFPPTGVTEPPHGTFTALQLFNSTICTDDGGGKENKGLPTVLFVYTNLYKEDLTTYEGAQLNAMYVVERTEPVPKAEVKMDFDRKVVWKEVPRPPMPSKRGRGQGQVQVQGPYAHLVEWFRLACEEAVVVTWGLFYVGTIDKQGHSSMEMAAEGTTTTMTGPPTYSANV